MASSKSKKYNQIFGQQIGWSSEFEVWGLELL
jgi:hypothetical protein